MKNIGDLRVIITRSVIHTAFLELIGEMEFSKLTVSDICRKAGINRSTFYKHYVDIYDLKRNIEDDFIERFSKSIESLEDHSFEGVIVAALKMIKEEKSLFLLLWQTEVNGSFSNKLHDLCFRDFLSWDGDEHSLTTCSFVISGILGTIRDWFTKGMKEDVDELVREIVVLVKRVDGSLLE